MEYVFLSLYTPQVALPDSISELIKVSLESAVPPVALPGQRFLDVIHVSLRPECPPEQTSWFVLEFPREQYHLSITKSLYYLERNEHKLPFQMPGVQPWSFSYHRTAAAERRVLQIDTMPAYRSRKSTGGAGSAQVCASSDTKCQVCVQKGASNR